MIYEKKLLFFLCLGLIFLTIIYSCSITATFGFFNITCTNAVGNNYYIYIDYQGKQICLKCNKEAYDVVQSKKNAYFGIEFRQSIFFPNWGKVTFFQLDDHLSNYFNKTSGQFFRPPA